MLVQEKINVAIHLRQSDVGFRTERSSCPLQTNKITPLIYFIWAIEQLLYEFEANQLNIMIFSKSLVETSGDLQPNPQVVNILSFLSEMHDVWPVHTFIGLAKDSREAPESFAHPLNKRNYVETFTCTSGVSRFKQSDGIRRLLLETLRNKIISHHGRRR